MLLSEKYIKKILKNSQDFFGTWDDDVEIIRVIATRGRQVFYIKWNIISHYTGEILLCTITTPVSVQSIERELYYDKFFDNERKRKLLFIQLKNELDALPNLR